jgi:hypothetical protein
MVFIRDDDIESYKMDYNGSERKSLESLFLGNFGDFASLRIEGEIGFQFGQICLTETWD